MHGVAPVSKSDCSFFDSKTYLRTPNEHIVQFYDGSEFLVAAVADFAAAGLESGEAVILVATGPHTEAIARRLEEKGHDLSAARAAEQLFLLDAEETLARISKDGIPSRELFHETIGSLFARGDRRFPKIRAFGEMVDILWSRGDLPSTLLLEECWNGLSTLHPFTLLCGYSMRRFERGDHDASFSDVCKVHSHVHPAEDYLSITDANAQMRAIALLQQRAKALEWEIEERKRVEAELRLKGEELTRSNEELHRFMYAASHDLKEPIRTVIAFLQLLQRRTGSTLDPESGEFVSHAVEGAFRMNKLVDGLLLHARVGRHEVRKPVDANVAFDEAVANLQASIRSAGASVTRGDLPVVCADPVRLMQIFQNLVSNGIKFHDGLSPVVRVEAEKDADGASYVFSVRDNGIGVEPVFQERIFVLFNRLHSRDRFPGSGIGLATCKKIIESYGGRIWVAPAPDQGTIFRFTLPSL